MTERTFRIFLGASLVIFLYIEAMWRLPIFIYIFVAVIIFEGITNWRVPMLVTTIRKRWFNASLLTYPEPIHLGTIPFEAERGLRLVVAALLLVYIWFPFLWILPWFVGSMLLLAGMTNICPMVMFFRWLGFR